MGFLVNSRSFEEGKVIPKIYTGEGEDKSPELEWSGAPTGTKEFALICDDPDAPTPEPWVHWVLYKIPATTTKISEGVAPAAAIQGKNSWNRVGYGGPMPPPGHGWHRYYFKIYALDSQLSLPAGASKKQLLDAMKGHILGEAQAMGKYQR